MNFLTKIAYFVFLPLICIYQGIKEVWYSLSLKPTPQRVGIVDFDYKKSTSDQEDSGKTDIEKIAELIKEDPRPVFLEKPSPVTYYKHKISSDQYPFKEYKKNNPLNIKILDYSQCPVHSNIKIKNNWHKRIRLHRLMNRQYLSFKDIK